MERILHSTSSAPTLCEYLALGTLELPKRSFTNYSIGLGGKKDLQGEAKSFQDM